MESASSSIAYSELPYYNADAVPHKKGFVVVSLDPPHKIHYREFGNPQGEPIFMLHGGPGASAKDEWAGLLDPQRYRVIMFDQRGCGQSEPKTCEDWQAGLAENDTPHLVEDIEKLREHLGLKDKKIHIQGGSWGSTLALAYAIAHPENIASLTLRGIFLGRKRDLDYLYQGNAADMSNTVPEGAYKGFEDSDIPDSLKQAVRDAWKEYVEVVPESERGDMIKAYCRLVTDPGVSEEKRAQAIVAWSVWEGIVSNMIPSPEAAKDFGEINFARAFTRTENTYFMNGCFLGGSGEENRDQNYILENVDKLKGIPIFIVHGKHDQVCPQFQADDLVDALSVVGARVDYRLTEAGHAMMERETARALAEVFRVLPPAEEKKISHARRVADRGGNDMQRS